MYPVSRRVLFATALLTVMAALAVASPQPLKRAVMPAPVYDSLPDNFDSNRIVLKLKEGLGQPVLDGTGFQRSGGDWDELNRMILTDGKADNVKPRFTVDRAILDGLRARGSARVGQPLPDLSLYYQLTPESNTSPEERLELVDDLNRLAVVEIAYFAPQPELASFNSVRVLRAPNWQEDQYHLEPAPTGIDAYYAWPNLGGRGAGVKVVDIEGNWIETHEDLHGGTDSFHISGDRIYESYYWDHGTAVLGEIAADSNNFGMTGIAFDVDLGTVAIGDDMPAGNAILTALINSEEGDIILIELHSPGPHYNFEPRSDQRGYVPMEYWQEEFDAILLASAVGLIVVEAGGNGAENLDDANIYGSLFDPAFRFSGAVLVAASNAGHYPASFTNFGQRLDVHAFGNSDVFTLGYGDLYGFTPSDYYTGSFGGTSSASPIIVGACAVLQGIHQAAHGRSLDHAEMRTLLTAYSTPQYPHGKLIGPLPDLRGSVDEILGVAFTSDTGPDFAPLEVNFSASSGLAVDSWVWDFGDGDSAFVQNPAHTYNLGGMYDVSVEVTIGEDTRKSTKPNYVVVLADSMTTGTIRYQVGVTDVEMVVYGKNTVPLREIKIPVVYLGDIELEYDSFSTSGCRTDYFERKTLTQYVPSSKKATFSLLSSLVDMSEALPPGGGPVLKIYFSIVGVPSFGEETPLLISGYTSGLTERLPWFSGYPIEFEVRAVDGLFTYSGCCNFRGDVDHNNTPPIDIADLVYLVDFMFKGGPEPECFDEGDVDASGAEPIDIADLVYLIDFMFDSGPTPPVCP